MATEEAHELGRDGVVKVKQFLESTTHLRVPWTVYDHPVACKRQRLDGKTKAYDLRGHFLGDRRHPLFVEAKRYSTVGGQGTMYEEYLADVYSITAKAQAENMDEGAEFMWITWHPFSQTNWKRLMRHDYVHEAVLKHPECLALDDGQEPQDAIDLDLCRLVADRLWMVVLTERQHELVLTPDELRQTMVVLKRGGA